MKGEPKAKRVAREKRDRAARIARNYEKLEMLRAMLAEAEQVGDYDEVRRLKARVRTLEQQILYMGGK